MLQNARFTAFTVSELLRKNEQGRGVKLAPTRPSQVTVNKISAQNNTA